MAGRKIDRIICYVIERDTETKVLQENNYWYLLTVVIYQKRIVINCCLGYLSYHLLPGGEAVQ